MFKPRKSQTYTIKKKPTGSSGVIYNHRTKEHLLALNTYLLNLHKYLGPYCFTSGAFVVEDDNDKLVNFMQPKMAKSISFHNIFKTEKNSDRTDYRILPMGFRSHTDFFVKDKENTLYEYDIRLILSCQGCDSKNIQVKNLKWYPFTQDVLVDGDSKSKKFVFLKFEGYPTMDYDHIKRAVFRYGLGINKKGCPKRREDCRIDKKEPCRIRQEDNPKSQIETPTLFPYNFQGYRIVDKDKDKNKNEFVSIIENYNRVGDEFFIPLGVSEFFLEKLNQEVICTFSDNIANIHTNEFINHNRVKKSIIQRIKNRIKKYTKRNTVRG
jgi:hypothetical protein